MYYHSSTPPSLCFLSFNLHQGLWCFEATSPAFVAVAIVTTDTSKIKWYLDQSILTGISFLPQTGQRRNNLWGCWWIQALGKEMIYELRLTMNQEHFFPLPLSHTLLHWFKRSLRMKITMRPCVLPTGLARSKCVIKCIRKVLQKQAPQVEYKLIRSFGRII